MNLVAKTSSGLMDLSKFDWVYLEEDTHKGLWYLMASGPENEKSEPVVLQDYTQEKSARWGLGELFLALRLGSKAVEITPRYKTEDK